MDTHLRPNRDRSRHLITITHIRSSTNPNLSLHQEYDMRASVYDELATVEAGGGWVRFADLVKELGIEAAVRSVQHCVWMSDHEIKLYHTETEAPTEVICKDCLEVAHA